MSHPNQTTKNAGLYSRYTNKNLFNFPKIKIRIEKMESGIPISLSSFQLKTLERLTDLFSRKCMTQDFTNYWKFPTG